MIYNLGFWILYGLLSCVSRILRFDDAYDITMTSWETFNDAHFISDIKEDHFVAAHHCGDYGLHLLNGTIHSRRHFPYI